MRVALITDEGPEVPGGVGTWVRRVSAALAAAGHDVVVAARGDGTAPPGVRRRALAGPSFGTWGGVWALAAAREVLAADRVVAATWPVATAWVRADLPLVVVAHGSDVTRPTRDPRGRRRVFAQARRWAAVSGWVAAAVPRAAVVLPAPVDAGPPRRPARSGVWGFVGRAVPEKGGDTFVRWVAAARGRGVVVGDGPALPAWRRLAAALGADVAFRGRLPPDAVAAEVAGWDLLAAPSRPHPDGSGAEGLCLAVLEAAALGVPAVATPVGGLPETGAFLVRSADPADAAEEIRAFWTADRGEEARVGLLARHGAARTAAALLSLD